MDIAPIALYRKIQDDLASYMDPNSLGNALSIPTLWARQIAAFNLYSKAFSKWEESNEQADKAAIELFNAMNDRCKSWKHPSIRSDVSEQDMSLFNTFAQLVEDFFLYDLGKDAELSVDNMLDNAHVGPGAAIMARSSSFYAKFGSSPLTATSDYLIDLYEVDVCQRPYAVFTESNRRRQYGPPLVVQGSRISAVPKNVEISRLICIEPSINQFFQLGIKTILETRLRRGLGIDLKTQPDVNRRMAFLGSVNSEGPDTFCTVDLKSASDTLSLGLLGAVLPPEALSFLVRFRSHNALVGKEWVPLSMFSTMGNGFTFPLQTILFSCAVLAARSHAHHSSDAKGRRAIHDRPTIQHSGVGKWSVFGDDIVCQKREYASLMRLLDLMGCIPNVEKSFDSGCFRESCGRDFHSGYNVRPVYIRNLKTRADFTVALNLLNRWSQRTGISLRQSMEWLFSQYRKNWGAINFVPLSENDDAGFKVPLKTLYVVYDHLGLKVPRDGNGSFVYYRRIARPPSYTILERGVVKVPKGHKSLIYNPDGLLQAFLRGEISGGRIIAKSNSPIPYSTAKSVTPNWDYVLPTFGEGHPFFEDGDPQPWGVTTELLVSDHLVESGWAERQFVAEFLARQGLRENRANRRRAAREFWARYHLNR